MFSPRFLDLGMASGTKAIPPRPTRVDKSRRPALAASPLLRALPPRALEPVRLPAQQSDLFVLHHSSCGPWSAKLAARVASARIGDRDVNVFRTATGPRGSAAFWLEIDTHLKSDHRVALVITRSMLREDWHLLEAALAPLLNDQSAKGRVIAILRENVTMPAVLRLGGWVDFRDDRAFEMSLSSLLLLLQQPATSLGLSANSPERFSARVKERLVSNLFPVLEFPKFIYSAKVDLQTEAEVTEMCGGPGPLPFLLKNSRLYSFQRFAPGSDLTPALPKCSDLAQEDFSQWLYKPERADWAIELLNKSFRQHAWKRGLRYDGSRRVYYYSRSKPKNIWWQIGPQTVPREVTAPEIAWIPTENNLKAEVQFGWRHQAVRVDFMQVLGTLFLRMEPTWLLTEIDGRTPMTTQTVGPVHSDSRNTERNGQALRSLQFWSSVLGKGHQELRINAGQEPVRTRLVPFSGFSEAGFRNDQMNYDRLVLLELEDDLSLPELRPVEQDSAMDHEEDLSSESSGSPRGK